MIKSCKFYNNSVYIQNESYETCGVLYIDTFLEINILDSEFKVK